MIVAPHSYRGVHNFINQFSEYAMKIYATLYILESKNLYQMEMQVIIELVLLQRP